ncbi:MAG: DUF1667 domain-containing protein [Lachnospiraceae bacterium]|nr:DUF1667 domain-containing protein [Lachnospiraceae bacterium]
MEEKKELTCIGCPMGCQITVTLKDNMVTSVSGNTCKIGDTYAREEVTDPRRTVTSIMKVDGGELPVVSVKTKESIPKGLMFGVMEEIGAVKVNAPIAIGQILIENVAGTGVAVVATREIKEK